MLLDEPNNNSSIAKIVLIQKGISTAQTFAQQDLKKFNFFKNHDNLGIAFLTDGTFRIIQTKAFKKTKKDDIFFHFESELAMTVNELKTTIEELGFTY